jgi:hypothetical protein
VFQLKENNEEYEQLQQESAYNKQLEAPSLRKTKKLPTGSFFVF